jgi:hypothetical protein
MGIFFRAAFGFAIALTLLYGSEIWSGAKSPSVLRVEADIAAAHPGVRLQASLVKFLSPQNDTTPRD